MNSSGHLDQPAAPCQGPNLLQANPEIERAPAKSTAPYSVFSQSQKRLIVFMITLAGFFSPFSAFIYFPAVDYLSVDLNVSVQLINLTITAYLIVQGIIPAFFGDLANQIGRSLVYLFVLVIYLFSYIGLALQRSYVALLILRMLQSAGSSGKFSCDVVWTCFVLTGVKHNCTRSDGSGRYCASPFSRWLCGRDAYRVSSPKTREVENVLIMPMGDHRPNTGPSLGPVVGGVLADSVGWPWIFWLLSCLAGFCLLRFIIWFSETCRNLVGNGSRPTGIWNTPIWRMKTDVEDSEAVPGNGARLKKIPNPFGCLCLIFRLEDALVVAANATFYMNYSCIQASLAHLMMDRYGLNAFNAGLCYLAYGIATLTSSYAVGKIIDWDYRATSKSLGIIINKESGDDMTTLSIEKARIRSTWCFIGLSVASTIVYGWTVERKIHLSVPLIMQFICGLSITGVFNVYLTLYMDLHPNEPGMESVAVSLTRCLIAAAGVAVMELLLDNVGAGWTFTVYGLVYCASVPMLMFVKANGQRWRTKHQRHNMEQET